MKFAVTMMCCHGNTCYHGTIIMYWLKNIFIYRGNDALYMHPVVVQGYIRNRNDTERTSNSKDL